MFSVNFVMLAICNFFCYDSLEMLPVLMLFKYFLYHLSNKKYLISVFKIFPFYMLPI